MHEGDLSEHINVGSLIQYLGADNIVVYGLVLENLGFFEPLRGPAVRIHWFDDCSSTSETIANIIDPKNLYISMMSESR